MENRRISELSCADCTTNGEGSFLFSPRISDPDFRNFKLAPPTKDRPEGNPVRSFEFVTASDCEYVRETLKEKVLRREETGAGEVSSGGKRYRGCGYRFDPINDHISSLSFFPFCERWIWISTTCNRSLSSYYVYRFECTLNFLFCNILYIYV